MAGGFSLSMPLPFAPTPRIIFPFFASSHFFRNFAADFIIVDRFGLLATTKKMLKRQSRRFSMYVHGTLATTYARSDTSTLCPASSPFLSTSIFKLEL
jgi:hypothetical protein